MPDQNPYAPPADNNAYMPPVNPHHFGNLPIEPPSKQKHTLRTVMLVIGSLVGVLFIGGIIAAATGAASKGPTTVGAGVSSADTQQVAAPAAPIFTTAATPTLIPVPVVPPKPSDFTATVKTMSKHCFGSAGCNVAVQPDLSYHGIADLTAMTCSITYNVSGDESGPTIETGTTSGSQFSFTESLISTPSSKTKIAITVTDVTCN
ncbi:MAG: hypothetical protein JWQ81_1655 [Amycolatopsis sp.]|jgi:hypothetical protein|uniref:hypothetical protein n=1 Tax=Amycolatopsis sp. TaxID=37632 RepID=UPI0026089805|nr:hypothetical protein [Amycolatopsis sp.]MCU1680916.1 hypothetical protein [Amycolatopsis sp.]